jgi:hypothetical protein
MCFVYMSKLIIVNLNIDIKKTSATTTTKLGQREYDISKKLI